MELAGLGLLIAAAVVVPIVVGLLIDGAARTGPLFLGIGLLVGVALAVAVAVVYTRFRRYL